MTLQILRGADTLDKKVVVFARSNSSERFVSHVNERQHLVPRLSILALPIDSVDRRYSAGASAPLLTGSWSPDWR